MLEKVSFKYRDKKLELRVKNCNSLGKFLGLMFKERERAQAILFDFKEPTRFNIHSLFVFFPFVAIWLDDKNKIVDFKVVRPFSFIVSSKRSFYRLIEIPMNQRYRNLIKLLCSQPHSVTDK